MQCSRTCEYFPIISSSSLGELTRHKLINVNAITLVSDDVKEERFLVLAVQSETSRRERYKEDSNVPAFTRFTCDEGLYEIGVLWAEFYPFVFDEVVEHHLRPLFMRPTPSLPVGIIRKMRRTK